MSRKSIVLLVLLVLQLVGPASTFAQASINILQNKATYDVFVGELIRLESPKSPVADSGEYSINYPAGTTTKPIVPFAKDGHSFIQIPDDSTLATATSPAILRVTVTFDQSPKAPTTSITLRIFPEPSKASVNQIVRIRSRSHETFILVGSSLLAPANKIEITVGGKVCQISSESATEIVANLQGTRSILELPSLKLWNTNVNTKSATSSIQFEGADQGAIRTAEILGIASGLAFFSTCLILTLHAVRKRLDVRIWNPLYLTYEAANRTFSLSKFQFYVWTTTIITIWSFVLVYDYKTRGVLELPNLTPLGAQFVASVVTLVAAQTVNAFRGVKGSGERAPQLSDLYTQGGVVAPERLLQLLWTIVGSISFLAVALCTYPYTNQLPQLDEILLILMGLPPAAYAAGKIVRNPGPVIDQIVVRPGSVDKPQKVLIYGSNLSVNPMICVGNLEVPFDFITGRETSAPGAFTSTLTIELDANTFQTFGIDAAKPANTKFKVINSDGQYATGERYDVPAPPPDPPNPLPPP